MVSIPPPITQMKTEFERARRWRRGRHEPLQFGDVRWEALDRFLSLGFPTSQDEEWRFTDVAPIAGKIFTLALQSANDAKYLGLAPLRLPDDFASEMVFVNGYCLTAASNFPAPPRGALLGSLSEKLDSGASDVVPYLARIASFERRAFPALNTALFGDGACILIPAHTVLEKPLHVRFISTGEADMRPAMSNPRVLVVLGAASQATIVESYVGPRSVPYFTNAVAEIVLGENAALDHYKLQCESVQAYHISATNVVAASGANCSRHFISLGGALVRDEFRAVLGQGAQCTLDGLYLADGERLVNNHTTMDHLMQRCRSRQVYNGILAGRGRSVFAGNLNVGADAHETDARQTHRTLLLSEDARSNSTLHFENSARKAHCVQRVVARRMDEDASMYGRSRGLPDAEARRLVACDFVRNILKRLPLQPLAHGVEELLQEQLHAMLESVE
jgi:Fe-S cluster assembly protein SufD